MPIECVTDKLCDEEMCSRAAKFYFPYSKRYCCESNVHRCEGYKLRNKHGWEYEKRLELNQRRREQEVPHCVLKYCKCDCGYFLKCDALYNDFEYRAGHYHRDHDPWNKNETKYTNESVRLGSIKAHSNRTYPSGPDNQFYGKTHKPETIEYFKQCKLGPLNGMYGKIPWSKGKFGPESANWKGGVSKDWENVWLSPEWKQWKHRVHKRDKNVCSICGEYGYISHHILPRRDFVEFQFQTWNGSTVCQPCHNKTLNKEYQFAAMLLEKTMSS